mgnify:CR=1 FL=1
MKIEKGTLVKIAHARKGTFYAIAAKNFDTEDDWYPIAVAENNANAVCGITMRWFPGEHIPCHRTLCKSIGVIIAPKPTQQEAP